MQFLIPVLRFVFLFEAIFVLYLELDYYRLHRTRYAFLVPAVKFIRSYGIILGMIEGLFTEDLGKSS